MALRRTIPISSIALFLLFITSFTSSAQNSVRMPPFKTVPLPAPKTSLNPMPKFALGPTGVMNQLFVTAPVYFAEGAPIAVAVADFNGDGNPDVAVANQCQLMSCDLGSVSVLLGNGDGTLRPAVNYPSGDSHLSSINVGDFNGDGKLDLIVVNQSYPYPSVKPISLLLGRGDGTFEPAINLNPIGEAINDLAIGDFNSDGKLDIAVDCNQAVAILFGNGDGSFQPPVYYPGEDAAAIVAADLNHDGYLDLIVYEDFGIGVMLGSRDGTFSRTHYDGGGTSVVVADVNGDGKPDVIWAQYNSVGILLGNGDGTLQPEFSSPWPFFGITFMATGDFNLDGKQDLAVVSACGDEYSCQTESVSLLLGNGDGTFQQPQAYAVGTAPGSAVASVDFNGDSKPDLVVVDIGGSVSPLLGNGDGTFRAPVDYLAGDASRGGVAADFNGDNKMDLAIAQACLNFGCGGGGIGGVSILLGNGNGTFQKTMNYSTGYYSSAVATADFNGDKKLDLAVVNTGGSNTSGKVGTVSVLLGNGDGTFQPAVNYATEYEPTSIAVGDFNGDGKLDLAVSNGCKSSQPQCPHGSVSFLFGKGDGTFKAAVNRPTAGPSGALVAGDFNGDGKPDLALSSCTDHSCSTGAVVIWLGKGNGTFQSNSYLTASQPLYIAAGDLNGDGKTDLVFSTPECPDNSCATGLVSVLLGNGDGTFQSPITVSTDQVEYSLLIADFDGDGKPDVIAESYNDEASLLLGNGDGTLRASGNLFLPSGHDLVMGDFNADGKPDFAVDGAGVAVLLNVAAGPFHYATAVDLTSSVNPAYVGQAVTLKATVTPAFFAGPPSGNMTFKDNGSPLATVSVSGGKAVFSTSWPDASTHKLTASYSGDSNYAPQVSPTLTQTVSLAPTKTMLTSSLNPSMHGQTVIFTATVTSAGPLAPTGKVVFKDGTKTLGSKTLSGGIAVLSESTLSVGSHSITAVYYGDTASAKSASPVLTQTVN